MYEDGSWKRHSKSSLEKFTENLKEYRGEKTKVLYCESALHFFKCYNTTKEQFVENFMAASLLQYNQAQKRSYLKAWNNKYLTRDDK